MSDDADLAVFNERLATYGPNFEKWPLAGRAQGTALLAKSPAARNAMVEAKALEALIMRTLDQAPTATVAAAFRDRVMNAAIAEGFAGERPIEILNVPGRRAEPRAAGVQRAPAATGYRASYWPAALAASLVLGLLTGASGLAGRAVDIAGLQQDDAAEVADVSLGLEVSDFDEEDML